MGDTVSHPIVPYVEEIKGIVGDIVECGSYKLDSAIIMARMCPDKTVYACDTFKGMPQPGPLDGHRRGDFGDIAIDEACAMATQHPNIVPVPGMFQTTLKVLAQGRSFSLAYIDCDLYESAKCAAETLWPHVVDNGLMVFDDYINPSCKGIRKLVDEMFPESFSLGDNPNFRAVRKSNT